MEQKINFFQKYLTIWVLICMGVGVLLGYLFSDFSSEFNKLSIAQINIPIAILIWIMIYPMMLKIDFTSIKAVGKKPKGLILTWIINWLIKPFTMFGISYLFFMVIFKSFMNDIGSDYLIGAILLGAAPCTAMVFVWSSLTKGNPSHTLVQVATNDLLILILFVPIVKLLVGVSGISIPWGTLFISIGMFVVIPLIFGVLTRLFIIKRKGSDYLNQKFIPKFNGITIIGLLLTLVLIFMMQSNLIIANPIHILFIAIPLIIQTFFIFFLGYGVSKMFKIPYEIAAPVGLIGASNFFELAVAVAIAIFPLNPGVALVTIVGVLTEVPIMLILVKIANKTKKYFKTEE